MNVLPIAQNGQFVSTAQSPYSEGDVARLECQAGHGTKTAIASTLTMDQGQLQWQPPSATCVPILNDLPAAVLGQFVSAEQSPYIEGDKAQLMCDAGHGTKTPIESTLTLDQGQLQWQPPSATCVPVLNDLPVATLGQFVSTEQSPYVEGDKARLECQAGHGTITPIESTLTLDQGQLQWQPPSATCVPAVNDLPVATLGQFVSAGNAPYVAGVKAQLECQAGYGTNSPVESTLIEAQGQLQWQPPSATCVPAVNDLPIIQNGQYVSATNGPYVEGHIVRLQCDVGHRTNDPLQSTLVMSNGQLVWDPPSAACAPVNCPPPPALDHGTKTGLLYTFPNSIVYKCDDGYRLNNYNYRFDCSPSGNWEPPLPPNLACDLIECPELQAPANGTVNYVDRLFKSKATFACDPGYVMTRGQAERECKGNGTWSGDDVVCEAIQGIQPAQAAAVGVQVQGAAVGVQVQGAAGPPVQQQPPVKQQPPLQKPAASTAKKTVPKPSFSFFWFILIILNMVLFSVIFAFYWYR